MWSGWCVCDYVAEFQDFDGNKLEGAGSMNKDGTCKNFEVGGIQEMFYADTNGKRGFLALIVLKCRRDLSYIMREMGMCGKRCGASLKAKPTAVWKGPLFHRQIPWSFNASTAPMLAAATHEALFDAHMVLSYFKLELKQMGIGKLDLTDVKEILGFDGIQ
ncbi:hypothetical protein CFP56_005608 [Quercus suber]|uniref:Uncharacterized protein n=1 Tax=Quercus suber TaxID=58331 RepID=A0AAW0LAW6_QUESU